MKRLLDIANQENIYVEYSNNLPSNFLGLYIAKDVKLVLLNSIITSDYKLHRCILAEELGHHFTSVGKSIYPAANFPFWQIYQSKQELKALKWSANQLIPFQALKKAIHNSSIYNIYELAEHLNVTPELLTFRIKMLPQEKIKEILCNKDFCPYL